MRRDLVLTTLLALVLLATVPSYDRVFTDGTWRGPAVGAALLALLVGAASRRLRLPTVLTAALSAAALLAVLPWLLGVGDGWAAGIGAQFEALRLTLADGWTALTVEPSPAAPVPGLVLLTTAAWWLIAALSHEVIVRGGHVTAGLLNLTVLWVVPLAIPTAAEDSLVLVVPFLATAGLLLLAAVNTHQDAPGAIALPGSGLLLLVGAIAVGAAAPWLLPGYGGEAWLTLGSTTTARGYQPIVDISNRLNAPEEREVLRVRSTQRTYLRLAGLDTFDGATWRLGPPGAASFRPDPARLFPADGPLPPEEPAASAETVEVDVEVLELENIYVPLPYQPVQVLGPIRREMVWSTEGGFLAAWDGSGAGEPTIGISEGSAYRVLAERPTPSFAELTQVAFPPEILAAHTTLPRDYPELGAQAEAVYDAAGAETVVERALALQDWFVGPDGGFTYDLDVPALRGEDALTRFVLEDRVGYCEYFATAMAVMLRQTGIPARVAVGFLPGERVPTSGPGGEEALDEYVVTTRDAHAWVEVLFPGYGWITFEPTPRSDETQLLPRQDDLSPVENEAERSEREVGEELEDTTATEVPPVDPGMPEGPQPPEDAPRSLDPASSEGAAGARAGRWLTLGISTALLALMGLGWWLLGRRQRAALADDPRGAVLAAQRRLYAGARRVGLDRADHETVREVLARWEAQGWIDRGNDATARLVQAAAFDGAVDPDRAASAVATLDELTGQLQTRVRRRERVLVPLRRAVATVRGATRQLHRRWRER